MSSAPVDAVLDFAVLDRNEQDVEIAIKGEDVAGFAASISTGGSKKQRVIPDPVEAFIAAARMGMFTDRSTPPWESGAELLDMQVDVARNEQTWRMRLWNIDRGAFRVLANMLRARILDSITIRSVSSAVSEAPVPAPIDLTGSAYPPPYGPTAFHLDYEMPDRTSRDRYIHLMFVREPEDAAVQAAFAMLDTWTCLLMLGGYPGEDMHPGQSVAVPEPAFLLDPRTIEQAFPDIFLCDDDCYAALTNSSQIIHRSVWPLELLLLR